MSQRKLSDGETAILKVIQNHYGARNAESDVIITDQDEAVIFVRARDASVPLMVNLTNLATWCADGTIATEEELLRDWLRVQDV